MTRPDAGSLLDRLAKRFVLKGPRVGRRAPSTKT